MPIAYKPANYTSLAPYLVCEGAQRVIDFLTNVLDATPLRRFDRPDGTIMHAELRIDDTVLMLADGTAQHASAPGMMHVYVPDVDATYRRALDAGATSLQEPKEQGDGDRRCGVQDAVGNGWWFATQKG
jgi:PhnB protein